MLAKLYEVFVAEEATLVEVNPLIVTPDREVKALDAKVTLDGNALYRHPENAGLRDPRERGSAGAPAKERGLTVRQARRRHRHPRQRCRAGHVDARRRRPGGRRAGELPGRRRRLPRGRDHQAVEVILSDPKVKAVLFNIFGGITRCDEVAKGLIEAFAQIKPTVPFVVRLDGTNDEEGRRLLQRPTLPNVHTEDDGRAAAKVVELAAGRGGA
jgi:succinyl-CoA synthetase beta subunit